MSFEKIVTKDEVLTERIRDLKKAIVGSPVPRIGKGLIS